MTVPFPSVGAVPNADISHSAAAVPSSSKPAKTKKKTTAASSVARQKNAPWTAAEDQRLRTIVAEDRRIA